MTEKQHWPFGSDVSAGEAHEIDRVREREIEREQARMAAEATHRAQQRNDRMIVGGRAHVKKPGLS